MLNFWPIAEPYATILRQTNTSPQFALSQAQQLLVNPPSPLAQALASYTVGACLVACDCFEAAQIMLKDAWEFFNSAETNTMALYCMHTAQLAAVLSNAPTATQPWEALIDQYRQQQLEVPALFAAVALIRAFYHLRDIKGMQRQIAYWQPIAQTVAIPWVDANLTRLQAATAFMLGDLATAEQQFEHASRLFANDDYPLEATHSLIDLAWIHLHQGKISQAMTELEQAQTVFTEHNLPLRRALCAHNQSIGYLQQGQFAHALHTSHQARSLFQAVNRPLEIGSCDMQLGRIYSYIGHWTAADAQLCRAISTFEAFGAIGRLASCYYNRAFIALNAGNSEQALSLIALAEQHAQQEANLAVFCDSVLLRVKIFADQADYAQAVQLLGAIEPEFVKVAGDLGRARCWLEHGWISLHQDNADAAENWFKQAWPLIEPHPIYFWRLLHGLGVCFQTYDKLDQALVYYEQAIELASQQRRQLANQQLSSFLFIQVANLFKQSLACAYLAENAAALFRLSEYHRTLTLQRLLDAPLEDHELLTTQHIQTQLIQLLKTAQFNRPDHEAALDQALQAYAEHLWFNHHSLPPSNNQPIYPDPLVVAQRLNSLHEDEWTLVTFLIEANNLWITVQTPTMIKSYRRVWDSQLESRIGQLSDLRSQRRIYHDIRLLQGLSTRPWDLLEDLSNYLLPEELQQRLHSVHRLYLIPSGVLHSLAWATLRVRGQWLCEQAIIQVLPYLMYATRNSTQPSDTLLQLACHDFGDRAPALTQVINEVEAIATLWKGSTTQLIDAQCQLQTLQTLNHEQQLKQYGLIHIATHAYMTKTHGMAGHIALFDSELWIDQITHLKLNNPIIIMSTCNGAVVNSLPGEEQISLSWSWLIAGAKAIVASLWPLDDGSTISLLENLYTELQAGQDVALALALAQRKHARQAGQSPTIWGNLMLIGEPMTAIMGRTGGTTSHSNTLSA